MRYKYCSYGFQTLTTLTSIDQKKFTLSLTLHWVVFWYDERVNISSRVSPYIQLSEEIQAKLWTPMIDIYPMKSVKKPSQMFGDNVYRPGKKLALLSVNASFPFMSLMFPDSIVLDNSALWLNTVNTQLSILLLQSSLLTNSTQEGA